MAVILSNCHTHSLYCDGKDSIRSMADTALALGFESIGFTGHAMQYFDLDYAMSPDGTASYSRDISDLKRELDGRIRIWHGIERDFFSYDEPGRYDYYIASVHYLPHGDSMVAVDGRPEQLSQLLHDRYGGSGLKLAEEYYELLSLYARCWHPPIIGHLDLVKKYNQRLDLFDENSGGYRQLILQTLRAIRSCGSLLEVNTGGMARGYIWDPYPSPWILREWKTLGGDVIVSSDCHRKEYLNYAFDRIPSLLRELGYHRIFILGKSDSLFETMDL